MGAHASGSTRQAWFTFDRRDWLAFDRSDYLAVTVILGITVIGPILLGLGRFVADVRTDAPLAMAYTIAAPTGIALPRGATQHGEATMELLIADPTVGERLGQAIPGTLVLMMTIAIAWLFFRLLRSIQAAEPFTRGNVRRINAIALIVGLGGMLVQLTQGFADNAVLTTGRLPRASALTWVMTITPLPLVLMLAIALIGEAFRRGIVLRRDVEGLV